MSVAADKIEIDVKHDSDEIVAKLTTELMSKKGKERLKAIQTYKEEYKGNGIIILFLEKTEEENAGETRKVLEEIIETFPRQDPKESRELHLLNLYLSVKRFEKEYQGLNIVNVFQGDLRAALSIATAEKVADKKDEEEAEQADMATFAGPLPHPHPQPKTEIEKVNKMIFADLAKQIEAAEKLYSQYGLKIDVLQVFIKQNYSRWGTIRNREMFIYGWLAIAIEDQRIDLVEMLVTFPKELMRVICSSVLPHLKFDEISEAVYIDQNPTFQLNKIIPYEVSSLLAYTDTVKKQMTLLSQACNFYWPGKGATILNLLLKHCPKVDLNFSFMPVLNEGAGIREEGAGKTKNYLHFIVEKLVNEIAFQMRTAASKTYSETISVSGNPILEEARVFLRILVAEGFRDPNLCADLENNCGSAFSFLIDFIISYFHRIKERAERHPVCDELISFAKFLVDTFNQAMPSLDNSNLSVTKPINPGIPLRLQPSSVSGWVFLGAAIDANGAINPPECLFLLKVCISSALRDFRMFIPEKSELRSSSGSDSAAAQCAKTSLSQKGLATRNYSQVGFASQRQQWQKILHAFTWSNNYDDNFSEYLAVIFPVANIFSNQSAETIESDPGFGINTVLNEINEEYAWRDHQFLCSGVHRFLCSKENNSAEKIIFDRSKYTSNVDHLMALASQYLERLTGHPPGTQHVSQTAIRLLQQITLTHRVVIPTEHRLKRSLLIGFNLNACSTSHFPIELLRIILSYVNDEVNDVQEILLEVSRQGSDIILGISNIKRAGAQLRAAIEEAANGKREGATAASPLLFDYSKQVVHANASLKQDKDSSDTTLDRAIAASKALNSTVVPTISVTHSTAATVTTATISSASDINSISLNRPARPILNFMEILQDRAKLMEGINDYLVACDPLEQIAFSRRFASSNS